MVYNGLLKAANCMDEVLIISVSFVKLDLSSRCDYTLSMAKVQLMNIDILTSLRSITIGET